MIHRLILDIPTGPDSVFQWRYNYRTHEYEVTRNGQPVIACTTRQECDDELSDLEREKRHICEDRETPLDPHMMTKEEAIALLFG